METSLSLTILKYFNKHISNWQMFAIFKNVKDDLFYQYS